jgi:hypothetical protein
MFLVERGSPRKTTEDEEGGKEIFHPLGNIVRKFSIH